MPIIDIDPEFDELLTWWTNEGHKEHPFGLHFNKDGTLTKIPKRGGMGMQEPITRTHKKIGRNEPCPCGSGKKYKKCHGLAA